MDYDSILQKWILYSEEYCVFNKSLEDFLKNKNLLNYNNLLNCCNNNLNNSNCLYFVGFISCLNKKNMINAN